MASNNSINNKTINASISVGNTEAAATASDLDFLKNRSGGVITTGDTLGNITFQGYDGSAYTRGSQIISVSSGTIGVGQIPANLQFYTADSTGTLTQRAIINSLGQLLVNAADSSNVSLQVGGGGLTSLDSTAAITSPVIYLTKNRSGGVISSGDNLGSLTFQGFDGSANFVSAKITSTSSGTIGVGRIASNIAFYTAPDSANPTVQRMVIASTGAVTINTPDSGVGLTISGGGVTATTGNITVSSGNLILTGATSSTTANLTINGNRFVHGFGTNNAFFGPAAGNYTLSGNNNVGVGQVSMVGLTSGVQNVGLGTSAGASVTSGNTNVFIGYNTTGLTTGFNNIVVGANAGTAYNGAESSNLLIGPNGVNGESNITRIGYINGTASTQTKCFIDGIRGITTDAADAIAVVISSTGQLGTVSSSIRFKENVQDMADYSSDLMKLRPVIFNYIKDDSKSLQVGLIAEEVQEIMPRLVARDAEKEIETVKYLDLPVLLLNEIQKLNARIKLLEEKLGV